MTADLRNRYLAKLQAVSEHRDYLKAEIDARKRKSISHSRYRDLSPEAERKRRWRQKHRASN